MNLIEKKRLKASMPRRGRHARASHLLFASLFLAASVLAIGAFSAPDASQAEQGILLFLPAINNPDPPEPPDTFRSDFTDNADGWSVVSGVWTLENGWYTSPGMGAEVGWASIESEENYSTLQVCARFRRSGCEGCSNGIFLRGDPEPMAEENRWDHYYSLVLNNKGSYRVGKRIDGDFVAITDWLTTSYAAIGDWNTLCFSANGSKFRSLINDNLVHTFTDYNFSSGKIGIAFYGNESDDDFELDWVEWTTNPDKFDDPPASKVPQSPLHPSGAAGSDEWQGAHKQ